MKRVGDLGGVGQHQIQYRLVGARKVQCRPTHPAPPCRTLGFEPVRSGFACSTWDDVEQLAGGDVDDGSRPVLAVEAAQAREECFVEAERLHGADPTGIVDQGGAIRDHGVVDGVPVTSQLLGDLVDAAGVAAYLLSRPSSRPVCHRHP